MVFSRGATQHEDFDSVADARPQLSATGASEGISAPGYQALIDPKVGQGSELAFRQEPLTVFPAARVPLTEEDFPS